jgi:16S rRNA (guanine527-N7)-methyltransferase
MRTDRITEERAADLLAPFLSPEALSPQQLSKVSEYLKLLLRWNSKVNLTSVRIPEEILTRHFGESFFAARHLFSSGVARGSAIDVGSGTGFPGLPIKIFAPELELTLIESNHKKVAFLREVVRTLELSNVRVLAARAEDVKQTADLVSLRAVERFERSVAVAARLLKAPGRMALLIGGGQVETAKSLGADLRWEEPIPIPISRSRVLLIGHLR